MTARLTSLANAFDTDHRLALDQSDARMVASALRLADAHLTGKTADAPRLVGELRQRLDAAAAPETAANAILAAFQRAGGRAAVVE